MTQLAWLADAIRDEGAQVFEHDGWKTRTMRPFAEYQPVGLIDHHTAGSSILTNYPDPPYWTNTRLETACNITIRPDGLVCCLNAGWAYDSGKGDKKVLAAVQADKLAPAPTDTYDSDGNPAGSNPGILGNKYFIDIEVQHRGDGGPIEPVQLQALILTNAAICRHEGWDPATRLIGHREWTKRKIDPRWNGFSNPMPGIRTDTIRQLEGDDIMTPAQEAKLDSVLALVAGMPDEIWQTKWNEQGVGAGSTPDSVTTLQAVVRGYKNSRSSLAALAGLEDVDEAQLAALILQTLTPEAIAAASVNAGVGQAVIDALAAELND